MSQDYVVKFEISKEYKRFHVTGVFTNINKNMLTIDLFEEASPILSTFIVGSDGTTRSEHEGNCDLNNYVHASAIIAPENLPLIIDSLQSLYHRYIESKEQQQSHGE